MKKVPPPDAHPGHWHNAVIMTHNAYLETFQLVDLDLDLEALKEFGRRLDERLEQGPSPELLEWIWDQLEQVSPRGQRYVAMFREQFREYLAGLKQAPR
jgi:hypothetical protein